MVARTIVVDTNGVSATDFDLSKGDSTRLFENGRQAAASFLDGDGRRPGWDFEAYKRRFRRPRAVTAS